MLKLVYDCATGTLEEVPYTPEEEAEAARVAADAQTGQRSRQLEGGEDAERLALIAERAATDPAFAALAELTLKGG